MTTTITILVIMMIVGIIIVNRSGAFSIRSREQFLQEFTKYVEGKLSPIEDSQGSFKVEFNLDQFAFAFEDLMLPSFKEKQNKAYLKLQLPITLTFQCHEKRQASKLFDQNVGLYKKNEEANVIVKMPEKLNEFQIQTNNVEIVTKLLANPKFVNLISEYKNRESGYLFIPIKITQGLMSMEFLKDQRYNPSLQIVHKNIHLFENHIKDLINIAKIVQSYT